MKTGETASLGDFDLCIVWGETEEAIVSEVRAWADKRGVQLPPTEDLRTKTGV